ncbi:TPA: DUF551 domain-containing protein [Pseudomonas aeruginosa]|uniref:DUF551 domain-containing protein n=1 Tax=Pseudomonas aeruginosa TaxID=287 RepID=UPI000BB82A36|nr:DUF551 domain-containing protein [Pseudomonas aeruginosa]MBH4103380.1 DUF551 domain-containing protein [Pseudomonas aeruginosa]PCA63290.1 hypothetical protein CJU10_33205 [Pseudomonas aeruginosa]
MSEWIKCSDHLPNVGDKCLIMIPVCGRYEIEGATYEGEGEWLGAWCQRKGESQCYKVKYWMPSPELPLENSVNIDWKSAPEWASHALTTGPLWDGSADMNGKIDFGQEGSDGNLYDGPDEEASCAFVIGNDAWVVVSVRPVKPTA